MTMHMSYPRPRTCLFAFSTSRLNAWLRRIVLCMVLLMVNEPLPAHAFPGKLGKWTDVHLNPFRGARQAQSSLRDAGEAGVRAANEIGVTAKKIGATADAGTKTLLAVQDVVLWIKWPLFLFFVFAALWMMASSFIQWKNWFDGYRITLPSGKQLKRTWGLRWSSLVPRSLGWAIAAWLAWIVAVTLPASWVPQDNKAAVGFVLAGCVFALVGFGYSLKPHFHKWHPLAAKLLSIGYLAIILLLFMTKDYIPAS
jgi:hypothetical protein